MDKEIRTCIISRKKANKKDLIQITYHPSGKLILNLDGGKQNKGRSVYLCKDKKVIDEFKKRGVKYLSMMVKRSINNDEFNSIDFNEIT